MSPHLKRVIRTFLQGVVGIASALPGLLSSAGLGNTVPYAAQAVVVSTVLAHVMGLPAIEQVLDKLGIGLIDSE